MARACSCASSGSRCSWRARRAARGGADAPRATAAAPAASAGLTAAAAVPADDAAAARRPALVCFLASHTSTARRAEVLALTLASARTQSPHPIPLHVSWSASPEAEASVRRVLAEAARQQPLEHVAQPRAMSQFEHLRELVRRAEATGAPPEWVCFTDDDDLWSERRGALFADQCARAPASRSVVVCTRKARPSSTEAVPQLPDAPAVRSLIASGGGRLTDLSVHDVSVESFHMDEYFDYAARLALASPSPRPRLALALPSPRPGSEWAPRARPRA